MKRWFKVVLKGILAGALLFSMAQAASSASNNKFEKYKLIVSAFKCNIAAETMAKSYIYLGVGTGTRQVKKDMQDAIATFNKNMKHLSESINNRKIKNLLLFNKMNYDELLTTLKEPYSLDNAQKVLDYVAAISEGSRHIAEIYKKEIGHHDPVNRSGLNPMIESIAKYYIAYQAGIKDENTKNQMAKTVKLCDKMIKLRVNYPKNTVAMNQTINKVNKLWVIVNQFYLDIDEGGLPFIVFKTTKELKEGLSKYNKQYAALKKAELLKGKKR